MFEASSRLFRDKDDAPDLNHEPRLAVAALLVHLAAVDGSTSEAERDAVRHALMDYYDLDEDEAISLMSVGVDFGVTQVADGNWGVHAIIRKSMFP